MAGFSADSNNGGRRRTRRQLRRPATSAVCCPGTGAAGLRRARPATAGTGCPGAATDMSDRIAQLKQLGELLSAGVLTQAEFDQQKALILNG